MDVPWARKGSRFTLSFGAMLTTLASEIVFDHFHMIKMMNDTLDRIRRKETKSNEILKHTRYGWLKNSNV